MTYKPYSVIIYNEWHFKFRASPQATHINSNLRTYIAPMYNAQGIGLFSQSCASQIPGSKVKKGVLQVDKAEETRKHPKAETSPRRNELSRHLKARRDFTEQTFVVIANASLPIALHERLKLTRDMIHASWGPVQRSGALSC